jgi:hypothetical protein
MAELIQHTASAKSNMATGYSTTFTKLATLQSTKYWQNCIKHVTEKFLELASTTLKHWYKMYIFTIKNYDWKQTQVNGNKVKKYDHS